MNKTELITAIAESADISKKDSEKALKAFVDVVTEELKKGEKVQLVGFGTFEVSERAAREGRNPQTGKTMKIEACKDVYKRQSVDRLSEGTLEQIYFSIRMAASEMLLEEPMPVILDDAFAFYDDKRLESVIKWLSRQKKQVIILSCHSREAKLLEHLV